MSSRTRECVREADNTGYCEGSEFLELLGNKETKNRLEAVCGEYILNWRQNMMAKTKPCCGVKKNPLSVVLCIFLIAINYETTLHVQADHRLSIISC